MSGFRDVSFEANKGGVHFAAGPDRMHLLFEGLGRWLLDFTIDMLTKKHKGIVFIVKIHNKHNVCICQFVKDALGQINCYIQEINRRTHADVKLKKFTLAKTDIISSIALPGILIQMSLAMVIIFYIL